MNTCGICFKGAMNHGGNLVPVPVDELRHWRPMVLWPPTPLKDSRKAIPGTPDVFCANYDIQNPKMVVNKHSHNGGATPI